MVSKGCLCLEDIRLHGTPQFFEEMNGPAAIHTARCVLLCADLTPDLPKWFGWYTEYESMTAFYAEITRIAPYLDCLIKSPEAHCDYYLFSGALVWSDEMPKGDFGDEQAIKYLLRYRRSVLSGTPIVEIQPYWEAAKNTFPKWPGFAVKRCTPTPELKTRIEEGEKCVKEFLEGEDIV